jgi:hypothetical protein
MPVKPWAAFSSDLPEGVVEDDRGGFVEYGGKSVTYAIAEMLTGLGCLVGTPRDAGEHGWDIEFKYEKRSLWCQITLIEDYLFVMEDVTPGASWHCKDHPYIQILTRFAEVLAADSRFHNIRWGTGDDLLDGPGDTQPVSP